MTTRTAEEVRETLELFGPDQWVEALRDPKYKHYRGKLGYLPVRGSSPIPACCLGVLIHAADVADVDQCGALCLEDGAGSSTGSIPENLLPSWLSAEAAGKLMVINDGDGTKDYTQQIAYIERNLLA